MLLKEMDKRFELNNKMLLKEMDKKMDKRFEMNNEMLLMEMDKKMDERFGPNNQKLLEDIDQRMDKKMEEKIDKKIKENNAWMFSVFATKDDLVELEDRLFERFKNEYLNEFGKLKDLILQLNDRFTYQLDPLEKMTVPEISSKVDSNEDRIQKLEVKVFK